MSSASLLSFHLIFNLVSKKKIHTEKEREEKRRERETRWSWVQTYKASFLVRILLTCSVRTEIEGVGPYIPILQGHLEEMCSTHSFDGDAIPSWLLPSTPRGLSSSSRLARRSHRSRCNGSAHNIYDMLRGYMIGTITHNIDRGEGLSQQVEKVPTGTHLLC